MQFPLKNLVISHWRLALAVVIMLIAGGYFYLGQGKSVGATLIITQGDFLQQVSVSGAVVAAKDVDLGFAANGRILGTYASVGQRVQAGTILAETENGDLKAILAQAQADLAALLSGTRPEEIAVAAASVTNAQLTLVNAIQGAYTASDDAVHNRTDSFFTNPRTDPKLSFNISNANLKMTVESDRLVTESALIKWALLVFSLSSENAVDSAKLAQTYLAQVTTLLADANAAINQGLADTTTSTATLSSYASTLATGRTNVNTAATTLISAVSALDSALKNLSLKQAGATKDALSAQRAIVANAQAALAKTFVVAPFTGVVTRMDAKTGEIVSPSTSLISLQSDGVFQIETYVPEVTIAGVMVGDSATTTLDAYGSSVAFPAKVVTVDPAETMKDGVPAYKTTLSFLSADSRIRSGMTANVVITIGTLSDAIVIPSGAIGNKNGVSYVSVLVDTKAANRTVTTGSSPALGQIQILSGLSMGDSILLSPAP